MEAFDALYTQSVYRKTLSNTYVWLLVVDHFFYDSGFPNAIFNQLDTEYSSIGHQAHDDVADFVQTHCFDEVSASRFDKP
jgi:hypothetical protein